MHQTIALLVTGLSLSKDLKALLHKSIIPGLYVQRAAAKAKRAGKPKRAPKSRAVIKKSARRIARRAKAPLLVISQDVFPEIAVELGRLENPALVGLLRTLVNAYLRRADRVVAIGETMAGRLVDKGVPRERLDVIPNWVNTAVLATRVRRLWSTPPDSRSFSSAMQP